MTTQKAIIEAIIKRISGLTEIRTSRLKYNDNLYTIIKSRGWYLAVDINHILVMTAIPYPHKEKMFYLSDPQSIENAKAFWESKQRKDPK